jgi:cation transport regulator ChaB
LSYIASYDVASNICMALPRVDQRLVVEKLVVAHEAYGDTADSGHDLGPGKIAYKMSSNTF